MVSKGWCGADYAVVAVYLALTAAVGWRVSRAARSTENFFLGSRSLPGWAVGFSLLATTMSSVTFLAYPTSAYLTDWRLYTKDFLYPVVSLFAGVAVAPIFRARLQSASAYELLETRFGLTVRLYAAVTYIVAQLLKLGTTLYLVAIPLGLLLGLPQPVIIVAAGVFVTAYSVAGGLSAVIFTDVLQAWILLLGGLACVVAIIAAVPGGLGAVLHEASEHHKLSLGRLEWDWESRTVPTILAYSAVHYVAKFTTFQDAVQRYLAVPSQKEVLRAAAVTGGIALPAWAMFYFLGTCLWAFYRARPDPQLKHLLPDAVLPHFILGQLPPGVAGLVVSGILAAAMSTMDSSLNAVSSVVTVDFIQRLFRPGKPDAYYLRCARVTNLCTAAFMIGASLALLWLPMESLNDSYNALQSVLAGGCTAIFLVALFDAWVSNAAALVAISLSTAVNVVLAAGNLGALPAFLAFFNRLHPYWCMPLVNIVALVAAYGAEAALRTRAGKQVHASCLEKLAGSRRLAAWRARIPPPPAPLRGTSVGSPGSRAHMRYEMFDVEGASASQALMLAARRTTSAASEEAPPYGVRYSSTGKEAAPLPGELQLLAVQRSGSSAFQDGSEPGGAEMTALVSGGAGDGDAELAPDRAEAESTLAPDNDAAPLLSRQWPNSRQAT